MASSASTTEQIDDPEMGATWFYSFVGIIFFIAFCLVVSVMFFGVERDFTEERVIDERPQLSTSLRNEQQGMLGMYGTYTEEVDEKQVERIRVPIERAIELMSAQGK